MTPKPKSTLPKEILADLEARFSGTLKANEPLAPYTSWKIGGPADLLAFPHTNEDILLLLKIAHDYQLPVRILGAGSNLLINDDGCRGIVIRLSGPMARFGGVIPRGRGIVVQAGGACQLPRLVRETIRRSLRGLEFAEGIPGTVGGGCRFNVGAYGEEIGPKIETIQGITFEGKELILRGEEIKWGYRSSSIPEDFIITAATLRVTQGSPKEAEAMVKKYREDRRHSQPLSCYTAGSVFKNPPGDLTAGRLIEEAGCKEMAVGQAQVSPLHANFIVNLGNATAADVLKLITAVTEKVREKQGVKLELEIKIWEPYPKKGRGKK